jgi:hypothetical protein
MSRPLAVLLTVALLAGAAFPALAVLCGSGAPDGSHACCTAGATPPAGPTCKSSGAANLSRCCEAAPVNDRGEPSGKPGVSLAQAPRAPGHPPAVRLAGSAPFHSAARTGLVSTLELPLRL